jgi:hypothetical protein
VAAGTKVTPVWHGAVVIQPGLAIVRDEGLVAVASDARSPDRDAVHGGGGETLQQFDGGSGTGGDGVVEDHQVRP